MSWRTKAFHDNKNRMKSTDLSFQLTSMLYTYQLIAYQCINMDFDSQASITLYGYFYDCMSVKTFTFFQTIFKTTFSLYVPADQRIIKS